MKKIFVVFLLNFTQLCFGAAGSAYAAEFFVPKEAYAPSVKSRRDCTSLVRKVDGKTKQPLHISAAQARQYCKLERGRYKCTFPGCKKPFGRGVSEGMTESGHKQHLDRHMDVEFQCISCGQCFKRNSQCYKHIAECEDAPVSPIRESQGCRSKAKIEKSLHKAPAGKARIESPLIKHIRSERRRNKGKTECLMCSLVVKAHIVFDSFGLLEFHRETKFHQDSVADFMNGKGMHKSLQGMHKQLNRELPKDTAFKEQLRRNIRSALHEV